MTSYCYLDGAIVSQEQASFPITDLGLQRGFGVFDFMRTYNGRLFHPYDHLKRFRASASELSLEVPLHDEQILEIGYELLKRSDLEYPALKFIITGGEGTTSNPAECPRFMILAQNRPVFSDILYSRGAHLLSVRYKREIPHVKSLNYLYSLRLYKWKQDNNALDLMYYDRDNGVTESPQANVFITVDNGKRVVTPSNGILKGITRSIILELAKPNFKVEIRSITFEEFKNADECFICSTSKRIIPITRLDSSPIGDGNPGTTTRRVMQLFDDYTSAY